MLDKKELLEGNYIPRDFCKEYVKVKGTSDLLVQFMATTLGIKKSYDDWFDVKRVPEVEELAKLYGLKCKIDWVFIPCEDVSEVVDGGYRLPTTRMIGVPYKPGLKEGTAHFFFAKEQKFLDGSYKNGWYPLVINNRAIHKPYIDILRFGYFLGYPGCCVNFFRKYNNWIHYNYVNEIRKNTVGRFNFLCNPLLKNHTYSYIFHMPCSFNCKKTIDYVTELRKKLSELEPELVRRCDSLLQSQFLFFNENAAFLFDGIVTQNAITYNSFSFLSNQGISSLKKDFERIISALERGNILEVDETEISISKDGVLIDKFKKNQDEGFILDFGDKMHDGDKNA